jgi:hypothetical protein
MDFSGLTWPLRRLAILRRIRDAGGHHGHAAPENAWKFLRLFAGFRHPGGIQ